MGNILHEEKEEKFDSVGNRSGTPVITMFPILFLYLAGLCRGRLHQQI